MLPIKVLGWRVSDKELTQESDFLCKLEPTDEAMADQGSAIEKELAFQGAKLTIPASTRGKKQVSQRTWNCQDRLQMSTYTWNIL